MTTAPVVLFVYNRPDHTQQTLDALAASPLAAATNLFIYADGAPAGAEKALLVKIEAVQQIITAENRFKTVTVNRAASNKGLANSIIEGVTAMVNRFGKVIVLEDDMITSVHFLAFMNDALQTFEHTDAVACISGYIYPVAGLPPIFFLKGADCWGWATWKRSWDLFEANGEKLLEQLNQAGHAFDFNFYNSYPYMQMLEDQIKGRNKSWAIRWYASAYLSGKLTLYPGRSLVQNIGFDGTGIHSGKKQITQLSFATHATEVNAIAAMEDVQAKEKIAAYFRTNRKKSIPATVKRTITTILKKIKGK